MNRRHVLKTSTVVSLATLLPAKALAAQTSGATPQSPADQPFDARGRELVDRLSGLSPLAVLEALETADVVESTLTAAGDGAPVTSRPWNDPLDTDLEHALGGVLIVASDEPVNSPDLVTLGAYIVFESPEIAFAVVTEKLAETGDQGSMSVAGTKAWMASSDDMSLAIMRLGYVIIIAGGEASVSSVAEGMVHHLDTLSATMG